MLQGRVVSDGPAVRRDLAEAGTYFDNVIMDDDPEPTTAHDKALRLSGLIRRKRWVTRSVPMPEMFVGPVAHRVARRNRGLEPTRRVRLSSINGTGSQAAP
jgi:hypothetical protein